MLLLMIINKYILFILYLEKNVKNKKKKIKNNFIIYI